MSISTYQDLLNNNTTDKFYVEYDGFLSNHIAHGIIALNNLGASPERIQRFIDWYKKRLEDPKAQPAEKEPGSFEDVQSLLGQRKSYYAILKHYETLLRNDHKSMEALIDKEFPKIALGMAGSALHGLIQLGYGYAARNERIVCEGLAYLFHSHRPLVCSTDLDLKFGDGQTDILEVLAKLAADTSIREDMLDGIQKDPWRNLGIGKFQTRVSFLLTTHGDQLMAYLKMVKVPDEIKDASGNIDTHKLYRWMVNVAITAYVKSAKHNDFFLLHGVTGAWSLLQILPVLSNPDDVIEAARVFLCILFAVYVTQDSPPLSMQLTSDSDGSSTEVWNKTIRDAIAVDVDEHVYKLVQVCFDMLKGNKENAGMYLRACEIATKYPLTFLSKHTN